MIYPALYRLLQHGGWYKKILLPLAIISFVCWSSLYARDWTVYLYLQAQDTYEEALTAVDQIEKALENDYLGRIKVGIDIQAGDKAHRILFDYGKKIVFPSEPIKNQLALVKNGCSWVLRDVFEGKTMVIFSGHGTGCVTPVFNAEKQQWLYEPDEGDSPYKQYCASQYERFCKQVTHIMEGKSLLVADGGASFLAPSELCEVMRYVTTLLHTKVDIVGFDSCYMAMLELAYELKDYARNLLASQECEEKNGWNYYGVMKALSYTSASLAARHMVYSYERMQRTCGLDRFSLSVLDLSYIDSVSDSFDRVADLLHTEELLSHLCHVRSVLHHVSGIPFYADCIEFLECLYAELSHLQATKAIDQVSYEVLATLEQLQNMIRASVAGPSCQSLHGCSLYFPTSHIDSSYTGSFAREQSWISFLRFFTTGRHDTTSIKVYAV